MDVSVDQQLPVTQQSGGVLAGLRTLGSILNWLTSFVQLTEEEQKDAGIYFGK